MEFVVIEKSQFSKIEFLLERNYELSERMITERKVQDPYMSTNEVLQYVGFSRQWLESRQETIGYYQDGKEKRFKRSEIDTYMDKYRIKRKSK